jgi:hypothetical protein
MSISKKMKKISLAKKHAPKVPGDTCPSIDYVQAVLEQITNRTKDDWADKQLFVANEVLEYIRASNEELRNSSYYWYKKYKAAA